MSREIAGPSFDDIGKEIVIHNDDAQDFTVPELEEEPEGHEIPEVVSGLYENLQFLATGGMGVAFTADYIFLDPETGDKKKKKVVIKTIKSSFLKERKEKMVDIEQGDEARYLDAGMDPEQYDESATTWVDPEDKIMLKRLINMDAIQLEARTMHDVQEKNPNPHVLKLIDDGTVELIFPGDDNPRIGIVMEYVEGKALEDVRDSFHKQGYYANHINIKSFLNRQRQEIFTDTSDIDQERKTALEELEKRYNDVILAFDVVILNIASQMNEGLEAIHASGIAHRDMKPANVMQRKDNGELVLADFGLAQLFPRLVTYDKSQMVSTQATRKMGRPDTKRQKAIDGHADTLDAGIVVLESTEDGGDAEVEIPVVDDAGVDLVVEKNDAANDAPMYPKSGSIKGTPPYLPPEFLLYGVSDSQEDSVAGDLYAEGVSWYEMKAGHRPFHKKYTEDGTFAGMLEQALNPPPEISKEPTLMDNFIQTLIRQLREQRLEFRIAINDKPYSLSTSSGVKEALDAIKSVYGIPSDMSFDEALVQYMNVYDVYVEASKEYMKKYLPTSVQ